MDMATQSIHLFVACPPAGVRVLRDGTEVSWVSMGVPLPMDPGEHVVGVLSIEKTGTIMWIVGAF